MAALISTYAGYVLLSFLPPVLWLLFYLREDRKHPEPKQLLFAAFLGGVAAALVSIIVEFVLIGDIRKASGGILTDSLPSIFGSIFAIFLVIAVVEEYAKYAAIKILIIGRKEFDEPIDAMIYMMTSALGFAAIENALFSIPVFGADFSSGVALTANRFIGANLLHALSSGVVGYFLAHSFFAPHRKHFVALGVGIAAILHTFFNYFIIIRETTPQALNMLIFLLFVMAFAVFVEFERLKRDNPADEE
ncbi:MAG: PrsW family intramembrane metalloprotease [Candidatus Sungbacteria bacterium]|nr:PrsW family intramembrane metalloprotease [Candidatus Sungbacteria bacterium]